MKEYKEKEKRLRIKLAHVGVSQMRVIWSWCKDWQPLSTVGVCHA